MSAFSLMQFILPIIARLCQHACRLQATTRHARHITGQRRHQHCMLWYSHSLWLPCLESLYKASATPILQLQMDTKPTAWCSLQPTVPSASQIPGSSANPHPHLCRLCWWCSLGSSLLIAWLLHARRSCAALLLACLLPAQKLSSLQQAAMHRRHDHSMLLTATHAVPNMQLFDAEPCIGCRAKLRAVRGLYCCWLQGLAPFM